MLIESDHISSVAVSVCQDMLGMNIEQRMEPSALSEHSHFASVSITGDEEAVIQIATCGRAASTISTAMFGLNSEELEEDEICDAVCEIANMIGGNIKGIFNSECQLSIPSFSSDPESALRETAERVAFNLNGGVLEILCKQDKTS